MDGQIIPAILPASFAELENELGKAHRIASRIQIDICDGIFVKSKTWPFDRISKSEFMNLKESITDLYLPYWEDLEYTADLMITDSLSIIESLMLYGFDDLVFHYRSLQESESIQNYFEKIFDVCSSYEISVNLAVDLKTNLGEFLDFVKVNHEKINYIQVMGIREIGKQGENFDEEVLEFIKNIKNFLNQNNINLPIFVDGGMNEKTISLCKEAGAEVFVVGSALSKSLDYRQKFRELNNI